MEWNNLHTIEIMSDNTCETLIQEGISDVTTLATISIQRLVTLGITKSMGRRIIQEARTRCGKVFGFLEGDDLLQEFGKRTRLTSGTKALDALLGGKGFETQRVYEIYGPEGAGKSTLLHQLVCTAALPPEKGGLGAPSLYIDADGGFSMERLQQIAAHFSLDPRQIHVLRATPPTTELLRYLCEVEVRKVIQKVEARLICLDTISSLFRAEYGPDLSSFRERDFTVSRIIHNLKQVVREVNGIFIFANQIEANPSLCAVFPWQHWGGLGFQNTDVRIRMRNGSNGAREFKVDKALDLRPAECTLRLGDGGFADDIPCLKRIKQAAAPTDSAEARRS